MGEDGDDHDDEYDHDHDGDDGDDANNDDKNPSFEYYLKRGVWGWGVSFKRGSGIPELMELNLTPFTQKSTKGGPPRKPPAEHCYIGLHLLELGIRDSSINLNL